MKTTFKTSRGPMALLLAAALALPAIAQAHASLAQKTATAGQPYEAAVRIGHGCEGTATHTVTVQLPAGFRGAKPVPKPGWALSIRKAALAEPYTSHGRTVTEDTVEVTWAAQNREAWLQDAWSDDFVLRGTAPAQVGAAWFKVRQLCEKGEWNWAEVPADGGSTRGLKAPAVRLDVQAPAPVDPHAHH